MKWSYILFLPAVVSIVWALVIVLTKKRLTSAQALFSLSLLVSADGGGTWKRELDLARGEGEYSYPAVIFTGSELLITYTWNRKSVAFARVEI